MTDIQEPLLYNNNEIVCMGIKDPDFYDAAESDTKKILTKEVITEFEYTEEDFTLLLSHRPELFDIYTEAGINLILTGHAHGGQFRLPFIGGLAAPNQGLFPKYDAGVFSENVTHMVVSRGVGNSIIPIRFNNPPEIVVVKLTIE